MKAMNNILRNMMIVVLLVLASTMQATAVNYKNTYRGVQSTKYQDAGTMYKVQSTAVAPSTGFQTTSAMPVSVGVGASTLNEDGTVNAEAYGVGRTNVGPRRSGNGSGYNPGTPDDDEDDDEEQQPLGDGLWILMVLACAYLSMRVFLKKTRVNG